MFYCQQYMIEKDECLGEVLVLCICTKTFNGVNGKHNQDNHTQGTDHSRSHEPLKLQKLKKSERDLTIYMLSVIYCYNFFYQSYPIISQIRKIKNVLNSHIVLNNM